MRALDAFLPEYEFSERHRVTIRATPERVSAALRQLSLADMPVARALLVLRGIRRSPRGSFLDGIDDAAVVLEDAGEQGMVLGLTGQFWRPRGGRDARAATPAAFLAYDRADSCKAVIDFRIDAGGLSTETRVHVADPAARRKFARYWRIVRPFSGLIRIQLLRAAKRRAERS